MNLKLISDSAKSEDYRELARKLPNNFVAKLISKVKSFLPTTAAAKKEDSSSAFNMLDNSILLEYRGRTMVAAVYVNGVRAASAKLGKDTLYSLVRQVLESEVSGKIDVTRPDKHTLATDQVELNEKSLSKLGVDVSLRFNLMLKGLGVVAKKGGNTRNVIPEKAFNLFKKNKNVNEDDYTKVGEYYFKTGTKLFMMKSGIEPTNIDEALAREPGMEEFYDNNIDSSKPSYIMSKSGNLYELSKGEIKRFKSK